MSAVMRGVTIRDMVESRKFLAVDLRHILDLLGERAIQSRWRASEVWATGDASSKLEAAADGQAFITGEHLSRMAHNLAQVIDGEFLAFENSDSPWIIIRAVDSSFYEVFSDEPAVLDRVRKSFQRVSDCEYVA